MMYSRAWMEWVATGRAAYLEVKMKFNLLHNFFYFILVINMGMYLQEMNRNKQVYETAAQQYQQQAAAHQQVY